MKSFFFVLRIALAWALAHRALTRRLATASSAAPPTSSPSPPSIVVIVVAVRAFSHVRRVRLIADRVDAATLANRHRRQIEMPFPAGEAFDLVDAAIRELPLRGDRREHARQPAGPRPRAAHGPYPSGTQGPQAGDRRGRARAATRSSRPSRPATTPAASRWSASPRAAPGSTGSWSTTAPTSRTPRRSRAPSRAASPSGARASRRARAQTATEKELTVAKLSLLHAQVEPHFLYNTLASAQVLTRSDPARADRMLGHLIAYLRHSLPRTEDALSTLGRGARARARLPRDPAGSAWASACACRSRCPTRSTPCRCRR